MCWLYPLMSQDALPQRPSLPDIQHHLHTSERDFVYTLRLPTPNAFSPDAAACCGSLACHGNMQLALIDRHVKK